MPRQSRIDAPDALQHVIGRGISRRKIFSNDGDRDDFLKRLSGILSETQTACYAWALIPNHFHLLLRTGVMPISNVMSRLLTGYAAGYNRRHRRYGHLFQNRYKSILQFPHCWIWMWMMYWTQPNGPSTCWPEESCASGRRGNWESPRASWPAD